MLYAATAAGVYRAPTPSLDDPECVLAADSVRALHVTPAGSVLAATGEGLYRSVDAGETWRDLALPVADCWSVLATDAGTYAGVRPAGVYRAPDSEGGGDWTALAGLRDAAPPAGWPTAPARVVAWVRALASHADAPGLLLAGVEVGGLAASTDGGRTWRTVPGVPDDVHHVTCTGPESWVVSCGTGGPDGEGGLHRTTDAGGTWRRLDAGDRPYLRASLVHDGVLYAGANVSAPPWTPPDAALLTGAGADDGLRAVAEPTDGAAFVVSLADSTDRVYAGTNDGRVLAGREGGWTLAGTVPVPAADREAYGVRSLAVT